MCAEGHQQRHRARSPERLGRYIICPRSRPCACVRPCAADAHALLEQQIHRRSCARPRSGARYAQAELRVYIDPSHPRPGPRRHSRPRPHSRSRLPLYSRARARARARTLHCSCAGHRPPFRCRNGAQRDR